MAKPVTKAKAKVETIVTPEFIPLQLEKAEKYDSVEEMEENSEAMESEVEDVEELEEDEVVEVKAQPKQKSPELIILDHATVREKNKDVKIIPTVDMDNVYIGGKYYNFRKNVEKMVNKDVERILRERDLIK